MSAQQAVDGQPVIRHGVEALADLVPDAGVDRIAEAHAFLSGDARTRYASFGRAGGCRSAGCNASGRDPTPEYVCSTRRVGPRLTAMANLGASAGWGLVVGGSLLAGAVMAAPLRLPARVPAPGTGVSGGAPPPPG